MAILQEIVINFGHETPKFDEDILTFLENFGVRNNQQVKFRSSNSTYLPAISFKIAKLNIPNVDFITYNELLNIKLLNTSGVSKSSPHKYKHINLKDFLQRMSSFNPTSLDHLGIDLPWFNGIHPEIQNLKDKIKKSCAYFKWPENEPWDFILPASKGEIKNNETMVMSKTRMPKFEIVSINKVSIPIIQIDFGVKESYNLLKKAFPEGIFSDELQNVWIYIKNSQKIDLCFVINARSNSDWSEFFTGNRLN